MNSFLHYVAKDIIKKYGTQLNDIAIVFPNKRASLFFDECLGNLVDHPIWTPNYITISDLFRRHSDLKVGDPIKLICDLHKTFVECTGIDETLDHFYGWGQLLIADFDDIDKNMADPDKLFANLKDIHELDDISYLTDEQKKMIQKFFSNFSDDHNSELKKRFLQLWSHFLDIYHQYNQRLTEQGLAYEGALYRQVTNNENIHFLHKKYLFVGFNMMQKVELALFDRLQKEGKAAFYWDYDKYYMTGKNEAGHYLRQYLKYYPNELSEESDDELYNNLGKNNKNITFISAPTENIQARYVREWLLENDRYKDGKQTAIILGDESLLQTVIHSLPDEVETVNITIGYPLQQTPSYSLVQQLIKLQTLGHPRFKNTYRLHYVTTVLRHPYAQYITSRYNDLLQNLKEEKRFYPTRESLILEEDEGLEILFRNLDEAEDFNQALLQYLLDVIKQIGTNAKDVEDELFQEALFRTYTVINRLYGLVESGDLKIDSITLERLIQQLIQTTNIPFHGEPAEGIQVMGVLETRNLDFKHILLLSCNEGNIPKGVKDASFIPYTLRKAYGLTTVDNKVAIFAYYFHSLLQRAEDITITYNNATDNGNTGEMSRFMLQLLVESKHNIKRKSLVAGQTPTRSERHEKEKDENTINVLQKNSMLSPTYLNTYLRCQLRFYFRYILGLKEPQDTEDDEIDNRIFGNIFHRASQLLYLHFASANDIKTVMRNDKEEQELIHPIVISKGNIENALKDDSLLYRIVDEAFKEELYQVKDTHFKPDYNGLQLINREVITDYLRQLLNIDLALAPFTIIGLELKIEKTFEINTAIGKTRFQLGGYIDRLDAVAANGNPGEGNLAERIRVIDYKTGREPLTHPRDISDLFTPKELKRHTDYYLQAILYSLIVKHHPQLNRAGDAVSPALIFIQHAGAKDYNPILKMGKELIMDAADYEEAFMEGLQQLIQEICNPALPFVPTDDAQRCTTCPYVALCK